MIHLLAQDYNKIRRNQVAAAAAVVKSFFTKRDLTSENRTIRKVSYVNLNWCNVKFKTSINYSLLLKNNNMHAFIPI